MSLVRMHFWLLVARGAGGAAWPRNTGLNGSMPAMVSNTVGSSGTREALAIRRWPRASKNARKASRISAPLRGLGRVGSAAMTGTQAEVLGQA